jgi:hypothetical protein
MTTKTWRGCGLRVCGAIAIVLSLALAAVAQTVAAQTAAAPAPATKTTWYFYTVKWGSQDEFLDLFQRNHYPLLKAQQQAGRFVSVRTWIPQYHGDGRADWTFVVELVERVGGATGGPTEQELIAKMYPDQATYRKEERRRFELLVAHWDVPLNPIDLVSRKPAM